jgi:hypothetical protein
LALLLGTLVFLLGALLLLFFWIDDSQAVRLSGILQLAV